MTSNVGLTTPRGSGTSGYVQRNLSHLKPRDNGAPYPPRGEVNGDKLRSHDRPRKPDEAILEHERRREVEVQVFQLRDQLEDENVEEDEIEAQTSKLRRRLLSPEDDDDEDDNDNDDGGVSTEEKAKDGAVARADRGAKSGKDARQTEAEAAKQRHRKTKELKPHQVHELARAKIAESEKLRRALGIKEDYEEGSHWRRQEERLRDGLGRKEEG
ncbi:MAG: RNA-splicing factor [Sclerophora amabilis]|nr:MAG: RNA-splicing factor [Sclerophora amabilis]